MHHLKRSEDKKRIEDCSPNMGTSMASISGYILSQITESVKVVKPIKVMIFGSTVKKGLAGNDIDLLIVSNEFEDILRQDRKKMFNLPRELKFDLFLFTLKEFEKFKNSNSPLVESIECDSIELKVL